MLTGCLTVADAIAAHRLATRGFWPRVALVILIGSAFSLVVIALAVSSRPYSADASNTMLLVGCVVIPGFMCMPVLIGRMRLRRFARKRYGMFAPTRSTITSVGIVTTSENAKAELEWPFFSHCVANDSIAVLFYENSKQYLILARSKLKFPEHWESLVWMIRDRLGSANELSDGIDEEDSHLSASMCVCD